MKSSPSIYERLLKSRLIPAGELKAALVDFMSQRKGIVPTDETDNAPQSAPSPSSENGEKNALFIVTEESEGFTLPGSTDSLLSDDTRSDETDFILDNQDHLDSISGPVLPGTRESQESTPVSFGVETKDSAPKETGDSDDLLNQEFLDDLENHGLLNRWQITQILRSRTRFYLGEYRIIGSLGSGGYGYVFLGRTANDPSNLPISEEKGRRPYDAAIKVLPQSGATPKRIARFLREIEINRQLSHPNIVRFLGSGEDAKVHYAVYEYMDGKTARQLNHQRFPVDGKTAAYVILETAKALFYLHQKGFIHRDIKPGNILFSREGDVKLGDLGLATSMVGGHFSPILSSIPETPDEFDVSGRQIAGTSDYLSPDQIRHPNRPSVLWDIYSLGCSFYYLVTGIVPFPSGTSHQKLNAHLKSEAPDPKMFNQGLSWDLTRIILEMMDKDPEKRPKNAEEICRRLQPLAGSKNDLRDFLRRQKAMEFVQQLPSPSKEAKSDFNWNAFFEDDQTFLSNEGTVPASDIPSESNAPETEEKTDSPSISPTLSDPSAPTSSSSDSLLSDSASGILPTEESSSGTGSYSEDLSLDSSLSTEIPIPPEIPEGRSSLLSPPPVLSEDSRESLEDQASQLSGLESEILFYEKIVRILKWSLIPLSALLFLLLLKWIF